MNKNIKNKSLELMYEEISDRLNTIDLKLEKIQKFATELEDIQDMGNDIFNSIQNQQTLMQTYENNRQKSDHDIALIKGSVKELLKRPATLWDFLKMRRRI